MSDTRKPRIRLTGHVIAPLPAALLAASGAHATAVANPDSFNAVIVSSSQTLGNVLANDTGGQLVVTDAQTATAFGNVFIATDGVVNYTLLTCPQGPIDQSGYNEIDQSDNTISNALITIGFVQPGVDDNFQTTANTPLSANVTTNDLPAGSPRPVAAYSAGGLAGTLTSAQPNGAFTYTPTSGFSGTTSFRYQVDDGLGCSNAVTTVNIAVLPRANPDAVSAPTGSSGVSGNVLSNDVGSGLTVVSSTQPAHGTANVAPDGSFTYFPNPGYSGPDSFTYTIEDADDQAAIGTVTLTVGAAAASTVAIPTTTPAALGLLGTLLAWFGLRRRRTD